MEAINQLVSMVSWTVLVIGFLGIWFALSGLAIFFKRLLLGEY